MIALFLVASIFWVIWQIHEKIKIRSSFQVSLIISLMIVVILFWSIPDVQSLYWLSSSLSYTFPVALIVFQLGCLLWIQNKRKPLIEISMFLLISMMAFITAGISEVIAMAQILLSLAGIGLIFWKIPSRIRKRLLIYITPILICSIAALIIMWIAPGREVRQIAVQQSKVFEPFGIVDLSIYSFAFGMIMSFTMQTFISFLTVFSATTLLIYSAYIPEQVGSLIIARPPKRYIEASIVFGLIFAMGIVALPLYGVGHPSPRNLVIIRFIHICVAVGCGYLIGMYMRYQNYPHEKNRKPLYRLIARSIIVLLIFVNFVSIAQNLSLLPDFSAYSHGWDQRNAQILVAIEAGDSVIAVDKLAYDLEDYVHLPKLEAESSNSAVNSCISNYYNAEMIYLSE